jgi:hypothetical protein
MEEALSKHYDYLHDVLRSPPVGPIADALAAMKDPNAAPLIASHLFDPAITDDDVKRSASALAAVATPKELPVLKQFFAMYRGTAASDEVSIAVASVAEGMLRLDAKGTRPMIEAATTDGMTKETAKMKLDQLLAAAPAGAAPKGEAPKAEPPKGEAPKTPAAKTDGGKPEAPKAPAPKK